MRYININKFMRSYVAFYSTLLVLKQNVSDNKLVFFRSVNISANSCLDQVTLRSFVPKTISYKIIGHPWFKRCNICRTKRYLLQFCAFAMSVALVEIASQPRENMYALLGKECFRLCYRIMPLGIRSRAHSSNRRRDTCTS